MKKFKIASAVALIVAIIAYALGILLTAVIIEKESTAFFVLVQANLFVFTFAIIGSFLIFAKNDAVRKLGNGLTVGGMFIGAAISLWYLLTLEDALKDATDEVLKDSNTPIGAIIIIVAAVILLVHYALIFIDYLLNKNAEGADPNNDKRIAHIKEWKQLKDEGFITEEEYEEKRVIILGIKPKTDKSDNVK